MRWRGFTAAEMNALRSAKDRGQLIHDVIELHGHVVRLHELADDLARYSEIPIADDLLRAVVVELRVEVTELERKVGL